MPTSSKDEQMSSIPQLPDGYLTVSINGMETLAVTRNPRIFSARAASSVTKADLPHTIHEIFEDDAARRLDAAIDDLMQRSNTDACLDPTTLDFLPCVPRPGKIFAVGLNFHDHAAEVGVPIPTTPMIFNKLPSCLLGHDKQLVLPRTELSQFDYEVELVMVVGRTARRVSEARANDYIFGYTVGNDFSERDLQNRTSQVALGKVCDGFAPTGPVLVPASRIGDAANLTLECLVNDELRQHSNTNNMIFSCGFVLSYLSRYLTLSPGDLVFMGTPAGPIMGKAPDQRRWLKSGDRITTRIEKLGELRFTLE